MTLQTTWAGSPNPPRHQHSHFVPPATLAWPPDAGTRILDDLQEVVTSRGAGALKSKPLGAGGWFNINSQARVRKQKVDRSHLGHSIQGHSGGVGAEADQTSQ
jgi:hypothetical protein